MDRQRPLTTFTDAQRQLLERGFPHLARIAHDHADDAPKRVKRAATKVARAVDPVYLVDWPREIAGRFLRAYAAGEAGGHESRAPERAEAALAQSGWPERDDIPRIVRSIVFPPWGDDAEPEITGGSWGRHGYPFQVAAIVYLLEAEHGTEAVLDAVVDTLEAYREAEEALDARLPDPDRRPVNYRAGDLAIPTGMLLLRAEPESRAAARARLERMAPLEGDRTYQVYGLRQLAIVLHGEPAVERSAYKWTPPEAWLFVDDDPEWVARAVASGGNELDVRGAWLGGEPVLDYYAKHAKKVKRSQLPLAIEGFGMLDHPRVAELMELWATKKGGEAAVTWLESKGTEAPAAELDTDPEDAYDALTDELVAAIEAVRGDSDAEAAAMERAAERYMAIRASHDEEPTEYIMHFFCSDGVALERQREPAFARLDPSDDEAERWRQALERRVTG